MSESLLSRGDEYPPKDDPRRIQCPDCPDGQLWDRKGPTSEACPTCAGNAFIWTTEPAE
jgi:uncharacterized protein (DUF983 family)